ncbi:rp42 related [Anaeramoeba ignava]|uniref:Defective in cullin neddylation protein n=1 Tax=Anaeramoeba ignava TaxID=1746090 RepID=A0A9Q0R8B2_ANAIG|nr:rp42 related [Anaeramoeba ignava]|eukprot:Anaeramoba_ignava/c20785_g2_i2.p1 GENE.c20785_g2_i2~~c20785_g2_i2.p1  ORF type:complete len:279 (-),score=94.79 c20785_g2_i2:146-982(-)
MNELDQKQRDQVRQFIILASVSVNQAITMLRNNNWDLEHSLDSYFESMTTQEIPLAEEKPIDQDETKQKPKEPEKKPKKQSPPSFQTLEKLFGQYKDKATNRILMAGVEQYLQDMDIDPMDVLSLIVSYFLNSKIMGEYSHEEFVNGWWKYQCDTIERMKAQIPEFQRKIKVESEFLNFYKFVFHFSKDSPDHKTIRSEIAIILWKLLMKDKFTLLNDWIDFLENEKKGQSPITFDTWELLYDFSKTVKPNLEDYDETAAWPVLIDEFVEYKREKSNN